MIITLQVLELSDLSVSKPHKRAELKVQRKFNWRFSIYWKIPPMDFENDSVKPYIPFLEGFFQTELVSEPILTHHSDGPVANRLRNFVISWIDKSKCNCSRM
ncbi:hypothetical protein CEXT_645811 [Caerostris extrusa]|uniref:Uncharacterized protein n=1 Tax=Caerostris extrusa TaxID=172846 RepID=A0AAV4MUY0_CAEEX|nr:hypothetical protein CEXT_645811 [Caerostris extrusa]